MKTGALVARGMRRLRTQRGMTQAQLAEAVERHEQFISQLEREARAPALDTIDALADAFGVSPWELLRAGVEKPDALPKRDGLMQRVRAAVDAWPEADQERLLGVITELGRLATSARRASPRTTRRRRRS